MGSTDQGIPCSMFGRRVIYMNYRGKSKVLSSFYQPNVKGEMFYCKTKSTPITSPVWYPGRSNCTG